jgi:hypothetical protein
MECGDLRAMIINFIKSTGIEVCIKNISRPTFMPGVTIERGALIVDENKLLYAGDLLHEAGHIAVTPPHLRQKINDSDDIFLLDEANEMAAIAWSYAACVHLAIDAHIVFHEHGYKGAGASIAGNFIGGNYFGVPLLQWYGMTYDNKQAKQLAVSPYPAMINWLMPDNR